MLKALLLIFTSVFWVPIVVLFIVIGLLCCICIGTIVFIIFWTLLAFLLKPLIRIHMGFSDARKELLREMGNELNSLSWWRFTRLVSKRYWKKLNEKIN
jgi:hypothetical protein